MSNLTKKLVENTFQALDKLDDSVQKQKKERPTGFTAIFKFDFWEQFFDFSTIEIAKRFSSSIFHYPVFIEFLHEQPDFYGPFWIYTTIILFIGISGNINAKLDSLINDQDYSFNYEFLPTATAVVYGIGFLSPVLLYIFMKLFKSPLGLPLTICLYGYSVSSFIIITPLCIIPSDILHYGLLGYGMASSCYFQIKNISKQLNELSQNQRYGIYGLVFGFQFIYIMFYKFYFFSLVY